jgi:hypothetical protein
MQEHDDRVPTMMRWMTGPTNREGASCVWRLTHLPNFSSCRRYGDPPGAVVRRFPRTGRVARSRRRRGRLRPRFLGPGCDGDGVTMYCSGHRRAYRSPPTRLGLGYDEARRCHRPRGRGNRDRTPSGPPNKCVWESRCWCAMVHARQTSEDGAARLVAANGQLR